MEKFGLFDLIEKFNSVANGKTEFSKKEKSEPQKTAQNTKSNLVDPQITPPVHYLMNGKMLDFCLKHDEFKRKIWKKN